VSSQGRFVVEHAKVALRPAEPVEYWIGASARPSIDRAARIADGWLASPGLTFEKAREQAGWYLDSCAKYGKRSSAVAIRRDVYVGESSADADTVGRAIVKAGYRGFDPAALVWGSVADVVAKFRALEPLGYTDIIVRHLTASPPKVLASLSRLAEVRKALQTA
jgi:alkanesulfonate monooxygenase SsuD/methylene tetrahydromethanopterin reductase-like flavin-dependent oxidoreductase (luciferase family)